MEEYSRGRTPNPCIDCNRYLKFGILLAKARALGFDYLATGHYARIDRSDGRTRLLRPKDRMKDQTYFLYPIHPGDLASILFPLGDLLKQEVRSIARKAGLPVAEKAESQDLCFVTRKDYRQFIVDRGGRRSIEGDIVDGQGNILGRHRGIVFYTIGQRSGLGVSAKTPLYVTGIDPEKNRIVVGQKAQLKARGLVAADLNLFQDRLPGEAEAKIRYRKKPSPCRVFPEGQRLRLIFREEQESITPGQSVVLYRGDAVLGGGVIEEVLHEYC
jgi:tRNA-specific 2-thiouridylase